MTSRYLGLVVVPGEYVVKIEVEEFASQMKGKSGNSSLALFRGEAPQEGDEIRSKESTEVGLD